MRRGPQGLLSGQDNRGIPVDTLPTMRRAQALYVSLGFQRVAAYRFNPVPEATFMKLDL